MLATARLVLSMAIALGLAGCGGDGPVDIGERPPPQQQTVSIPMRALNGSGQDGTAALTQTGDASTTIVVTLENAPSQGDQPAEIRAGTCSRIGAEPEHGMQAVEQGKSTSVVPARLRTLVDRGLVIAVHKSGAETDAYVSCGEIAGG